MADLKPEAQVQQDAQVAASRAGGRLWRNNSGAFYDEHGRLVRYGLGNVSKRVNDSIKSSDLVGITPVLITQDMVGTTVGLFTAVECKKEGWTYAGIKREVAQKKFIDMVISLGGRAKFYAGGE